MLVWVATSHNLTLLSPDAVMTCELSGLHDTYCEELVEYTCTCTCNYSVALKSNSLIRFSSDLKHCTRTCQKYLKWKNLSWHFLKKIPCIGYFVKFFLATLTKTCMRTTLYATLLWETQLTPYIPPSWALSPPSLLISSPVLPSYNAAIQSEPPLHISSPFGENRIELTKREWA